MVEREDHQGNQVLNVDPRHPLAPAADPPAGAHTERRQHALQRAAFGGRAPCPSAPLPRVCPGFGGPRLLFPGHGRLRQESPSRESRIRSGSRRRASRSSRWRTSRPGLCGRFGSPARISTRRRVPLTRLSRMRCLAAGVQRCATGSPARWMTASASRRRGGGSLQRSRAVADGCEVGVAGQGRSWQTVADESGGARNGDVHGVHRSYRSRGYRPRYRSFGPCRLRDMERTVPKIGRSGHGRSCRPKHQRILA